MQLGDAAEISLSVDDVEDAARYFEQLGFRRTKAMETPYPSAAFTDSDLVLSLHEVAFPSPTLTYFGAPLDALAAAFAEQGLSASELWRKGGQPAALELFSPGGLRLVLMRRASLSRRTEPPAPSRCGRFAELALPTRDRAASAAFWTRFGFQSLRTRERPYPWGTYTDDTLALGLHETTDFDAPALIFFAEDSTERIAALKQKGLLLTREAEGRHAALSAPGGLLLFLFQGAVPA